MADRFNGEYMILKRNPNYRGPARARLDAIAFREGLAPENAVARVKSGEWDGALLADALLGPDSTVARQARRDRASATRSSPTGAPGAGAACVRAVLVTPRLLDERRRARPRGALCARREALMPSWTASWH